MPRAREEDMTRAPVPQMARMVPHIIARPGVKVGSSLQSRTGYSKQDAHVESLQMTMSHQPVNLTSHANPHMIP